MLNGINFQWNIFERGKKGENRIQKNSCYKKENQNEILGNKSYDDNQEKK